MLQLSKFKNLLKNKMTYQEALVKALVLSITATTAEDAEKTGKLVDQFSSLLTEQEVVHCKEQALSMVEGAVKWQLLDDKIKNEYDISKSGKSA